VTDATQAARYAASLTALLGQVHTDAPDVVERAAAALGYRVSVCAYCERAGWLDGQPCDACDGQGWVLRDERGAL
jgi:hypothetical protein